MFVDFMQRVVCPGRSVVSNTNTTLSSTAVARSVSVRSTKMVNLEMLQLPISWSYGGIDAFPDLSAGVEGEERVPYSTTVHHRQDVLLPKESYRPDL